MKVGLALGAGTKNQGLLGSLASILPSANFQIDVERYDPAVPQLVKNLIATPNDGVSAQSAYDFRLGLTDSVEASDPVYSTNPKKFTLNGSQYLYAKSTPAWIRNNYDVGTTGSFWVIGTYKTAARTASQSLFGNSNGSSITGWRVDISTTGLFRFARNTGVTSVADTAGTVPANGVRSLSIFCYNNATREMRFAHNSRTLGTATAQALTGPLVTGTGTLGFGTASTGSARMLNGTELYGMAMGNGMLDNTQVNAIVNYYNKLHNVTYA